MLFPRIIACRLSQPKPGLSCRRSYTSVSRLFTRGTSLPRVADVALAGQIPRTLPRRLFSDKAESTITDAPVLQLKLDETEYVGPLSNTFRRLKIFSLASFGFGMTLAPFMFIIESNLPYSARLALASIAIGTSGLSTSLVAWCARPYVNTLRRHRPDGDKDGEVLELTTMSLFMHPRITKIYDPEFLLETRRPMAKWELARQMVLPASRLATEGKELVGTQETVAETIDQTGKVLGRWIVTWGENGEGTCHEAGKVIRYFNVHEELL